MSDLDTLMSKLAEEMTDRDIDEIIAYQRQRRAEMESGVKPKRDTGPKKTTDLLSLKLAKPKPILSPIRRF